MYTLFRDVGFRKALSAEAPTLLLSMFVAESLYKFHSFTLECGAFLTTWWGLSYLFSLLQRSLWAGKPAVRVTATNGASGAPADHRW